MGANKSYVRPDICDDDIYLLIDKTGQSRDVIMRFIEEIFYFNPDGRLNMETFCYLYKKLYLGSFISLRDDLSLATNDSSVSATAVELLDGSCNCGGRGSGSGGVLMIKKQSIFIPNDSSTGNGGKENQKNLLATPTSMMAAASTSSRSPSLTKRSFVNLLPLGQSPLSIEPATMEKLRIKQAFEFADVDKEKLIKATLLAEKCFNSFDLNKVGYLNLNDLLIAYVTTTEGDLQKKLAYTFKYYDKNRDRRLDRSEIKTIVQVMYNMLDMNSEDESEYMDYESCVDYIIQKLDENHDNLISLDEFSKNLLNDEILCNLLAPFR